MTTIRFDDVEALNAAASTEFGPWGTEVRVTQEMIDQFAELTGDRQWIHVDVERANRESPFGGPVAHGFLTLSLIPQLLSGGDVTITGFTNAANYGADKLRFVAPVPAGSPVHSRGRLVEAAARPKGTLVTTESRDRGGRGRTAGTALFHADPLYVIYGLADHALAAPGRPSAEIGSPEEGVGSLRRQRRGFSRVAAPRGAGGPSAFTGGTSHDDRPKED